MAEDRLHQDKLYLALTRPTMVLGVPLEAAFISIMVGGLSMIVSDSLFYLLLALPLLIISNFIVKRDQNAFRILFRFFDTGARCRNRAYWGGSSATPLRIQRLYKVTEID